MNQYVFILNDKGERITSRCNNTLSRDDIMAQAEHDYPNAQYVYSADGDSMLDEFLAGKAYVNGVFVDAPVIEYTPTKAEKIAYIKKYYDERFATLDQALVRRRLINSDITDLQEQYKQLNLEMVAKIKEVK